MEKLWLKMGVVLLIMDKLCVIKRECDRNVLFDTNKFTEL